MIRFRLCVNGTQLLLLELDFLKIYFKHYHYYYKNYTNREKNRSGPFESNVKLTYIDCVVVVVA